jgi:hypothetical protein
MTLVTLPAFRTGRRVRDKSKRRESKVAPGGRTAAEGCAFLGALASRAECSSLAERQVAPEARASITHPLDRCLRTLKRKRHQCVLIRRYHDGPANRRSLG